MVDVIKLYLSSKIMNLGAYILQKGTIANLATWIQ